MSLLITWIILPSALVFPLGWLYSLALIRGIACARDEQHRITPLSPWFYFSMKFKRLLIFTACFSPPWLLFATVFLYASMGNSSVWTSGVPKEEHMNFATVYFSHIGLMVIILATITRFVPRFASPFIVASIAVILGIIIWAILFLGVSAMNLYDTQNQFFFILFSVLGLVSFVLVWLQVRFKLNRAWFCFEDS